MTYKSSNLGPITSWYVFQIKIKDNKSLDSNNVMCLRYDHCIEQVSLVQLGNNTWDQN